MKEDVFLLHLLNFPVDNQGETPNKNPYLYNMVFPTILMALESLLTDPPFAPSEVTFTVDKVILEEWKFEVLINVFYLYTRL